MACAANKDDRSQRDRIASSPQQAELGAEPPEEQPDASPDRLSSLSRYLESVREDERTKLAHEIHDELAQTLTALKIEVCWLKKRLPQEQESLVQKTESMAALVDEAIDTVKRISGELRPGVLDQLGLVAAIEQLTREFGERMGIRATFAAHPEEIVLERELSTAIFRVCQEALTNVARHADATTVRVNIRETAQDIVLEVRDDGSGFDESRALSPEAYGLIGMRERACCWGGRVKITGAPGTGTVVLFEVPVRKKGDARCREY